MKTTEQIAKDCNIAVNDVQELSNILNMRRDAFTSSQYREVIQKLYHRVELLESALVGMRRAAGLE